MRVAIIADSHFCETSRFDECVRLHQWIAEDARKRGVDLVLHAGDLYERRSTPTERAAAATWVQAMADLAPVLMVRGNHDALGDLPLLERLKTKHPVFVEEAWNVYTICDARIAGVAWPRKGELLARAAGAGQEATSAGAETALRNVLGGLGAKMAEHEGPKILLMHAMVRGSVTSGGQPLVGCDLELGLEDLALAGTDLVALGHIHQHQEWKWDGVPIIYPGAPRRTAFGETEAKGYTWAELRPDTGLTAWMFIETPATKMLMVEAEYVADLGLVAFDATGAEGAEVRFRYQVNGDQRDAARAAAKEIADKLRAAGAVAVQVEERVRSVTRARAPEVSAAKTTAEKLEALWRSRGLEMPPERRAQILERLAELEGGGA